VKIHWYWPFARAEELEWAHATAREGDRILVQVVDRSIAPIAGTEGRVQVVRDLPDVNRQRQAGVLWPISRAATYASRARQRRKSWEVGEFDLAHIHYLNRFTDAWRWRDAPRTTVLSVHDLLPHDRRGPRAVELATLKRLYGGPDALIVHHEWLRERLVDDFDVDPGKVHIVGHQVFPVPEHRRSAVPPAGAPMVLFFGAMRRNKGADVLAEAIARVPSDLDVRFYFAGRGDSRVERLVRELAGSDPRVQADLSFVTAERKDELFMQSSIVVLPYTEFSSQSGVLHDAYGHRRPVLVSDVGALGETVRSEGTGLVVPKSSPKRLADGIVELVTSPQRWASMASAAEEVALKRSPEATGAELRAVYDRVAT